MERIWVNPTIPISVTGGVFAFGATLVLLPSVRLTAERRRTTDAGDL